MYRVALFVAVVLMLMRLFQRRAAHGANPPPGARFRISLYQQGRPAKTWYAKEIRQSQEGVAFTDMVSGNPIGLPSREGVVLEKL